MTTNLIKPSRIDFDKVDINQIQRILSTGTLEEAKKVLERALEKFKPLLNAKG